MTKIEEVALAHELKDTKLSIAQAEALLLIIKATGNETVCVELLCGVYEEPEISKVPIKSMGFSNRGLYVFDSYDPFTGKVKYTYSLYKTESVWVEKEGALPEFGTSGKEELEYDPKLLQGKLGLTMTEFNERFKRETIKGTCDETIRTDSCKLSDWQ